MVLLNLSKFENIHMAQSLIEIRDLTKTYKTGGETTNAIQGLNLDIKEGEFVAIMGPSGSGKSTLMHILGLLDKPTSGTYSLNGTNVSKLKANQQAKIRNQEIGFVFQQFNLLARTSVLDNVLLPSIYGNLKSEVEAAKQLIERVGLQDRLKNKSNQLSGGQIQRVAIARALIMNPSIILADEPTGNLDSKRGKEIMDLFQSINKEGRTVVLITHEDEIAEYAKRKIVLRDGVIISDELN